MRRQVAFVIIGAVAFAAASLVHERPLRMLSPVLFLAAVVLLALVLGPVGDVRAGAQRWIPIGPFQLQPAELAKPALIVAMAALLAPVEEGPLRWSRVLQALMVVAVPSALIFVQPDLGTMLVFAFIGLAMLFVGGATFRQVLILAVGGFLVFAVMWGAGAVEEYQVDRLTAFLDQGSNLDTANYNQSQSQIAIGSGQLFGKGLFEGSQTNLSFVPSQTTDFIFTAVGEQLGFMGSALIVFLYAVVVWRLLMAAANANTRFGQLIAVGAAALTGFHVFINVGMTIGLLPVTGLPLPFMSHGGSAFVAMALALGITHSVWVQRSPVKGERRLL